MDYVKVNGVEYPAQVSGSMNDSSWDGRESATIQFDKDVMTYSLAKELFVEGTEWSIICEWTETPEEGEPIIHRDEFDKSDFSVAGEITDRRDGVVLVKCGKLTEIESLLADIYGNEV